MDPIAAAEVATALIPFAPLIAGAAEGLGKSATEGITGAAATWAIKGWQSIRRSAKEKDTRRDAVLTLAVEELASDPTSSERQAEFAKRVGDTVRSDSELGNFLERWLAEGHQEGHVSNSSGVTIHGDVVRSVVVQGNRNQIWNGDPRANL